MKYISQHCFLISQLLESTCRIANVFKREGVKKGDRVALYMPASPLLAASMLACARIGAIHRYTYIHAHTCFTPLTPTLSFTLFVFLHPMFLVQCGVCWVQC